MSLGMMPLFWVLLWSMLHPLALSCGQHCCIAQESDGLQKTSPLLTSLRCHNDYKSFVHCEWRELANESLQLWFKTENDAEKCAPHSAEVQDGGPHRTAQCRYSTSAFSLGIKHTVFFVEGKAPTPCSSGRLKPGNLHQHLRTRPPENVSTRGAGDGDRRLVWSSPYPSSSTLNEGLTYQLSYRTDRQDDWTTEDLTDTSVKLEKRLLLPGHLYEARVRARASVAQWSVWSPEVTWRSEEGAGLLPSLHCVLDGEKAVTCSWRVSREVDHYITHQLACRLNQTAASERCCVNLTVSPDPGRPVLRYSCSLAVADPARLLVELLPTRKAKTFHVSKHIRPSPPLQVKVRQKDTNWMVEWIEPSIASKVRLHYQVCYYSTEEQGSYVLQNISKGSKSLSILGTSLVPSRRYWVKVRSLVNPSDYEGVPSEWTDPVEWTSLEATWSPTTLIYFTLGLFVAAVFLTIYFTVPACRRRAVLWVDSVPSPGKSKILSEIKLASDGESMSICQVMRLDSVMSTCSSAALLWPIKDAGQRHLEQDEGCWECDNLSPPAEKNKHSDTSSMSFSGPYIFCQSSEPSHECTGVRGEDKEMQEEPPPDDSLSPSPMMSALFGEGYVCLPGRGVSRSTQDLVSHSDAEGTPQRHGHAEQDQQCLDDTEVPPGPSETASDLTSGLSSPPWCQAQASGYCHLPAAFVSAAK
ncbi:cytokine receptor common subunit beta [Pungitius pungitius]|uniref:cytokine receptor common subunit beta n=1 Tax=Pungitius pungitius TaxID=134920 RepID=UPI002E143F1F